MRLIILVTTVFFTLTASAYAQTDREPVYPKVTSSEDYISPFDPLQDRDAGTRERLVAALTEQQLNRGYPPQAAIVLVGFDAEEMVIMSLHRHTLATSFQARAYLTQLAPSLRNLKMVADSGAARKAGTLDILKLFGFRRVVVSDGESYSLLINVF
ncbi:hypothetical protein [Denitrobaculum tricleocarpae]|uniref:Uncharacterized protein n=1 Tax=Denitrobaculum tricleocarpae TaxID=2591009 RepID=A0A545TM40_9PROT|nr:hypothetical protein [Denitrobaculum tricleocarpae]TQV78315.1 hypothetical protein FKG95_17240 [Denitrobaculum tricleocarpae]